MKKRWYFLPAASILILAVTFLPSRIASAAEACGQWDTVSVMGGEYTIQNNVWGATTAQCISVPSTSSNAFTVSSSSHNQGSVAAYPSVYKGCHFGDCTTNSGMPILISQVTSAPFTWNVTRVSTGVWNIAAEAWFSPITDSTDGYNGGAELMIWLDYMGMQPAGSQIGTVAIGGATWEVWYSNIGWNYIAYRRVGAAISINADLKSFINDAVSRGYIQTSWYLHDFEAGTELMTGGAGFASNAFTFAVNSGTPPPTTPPPTTPPPTTPPPTTQPPAGVCQVGYTMNQWSNGFTADVKITNNGSSAIQGWTLGWSFANGQQITGSWNATVSQSGANVTASNPASNWNGTIGANGGSVSFGFQATHTGTNAVPTSFTLNGVACNGGTVTPPPTTPPPTTPPPTTPAVCSTPIPVPFASLSVAPTTLEVGQTTQVTFSSSNVGMPQYTLYAGNDRIAIFRWGGGVDVYNESPLLRLTSGTTLPAVLEAVAPGTVDLRVGANGEVIAGWYDGCTPSYTFTTVYSSLVPVSVSGIPEVTDTPTPTTTPTIPPSSTCSISYVSQNDWGSGATVNVTIRNNSTSDVSGWTLTWTFPGNQQIGNLWNGSYTQSGASVSVRNLGWNATIGANGGTTSFGFNIAYSGVNAVPASFFLNGMRCQSP